MKNIPHQLWTSLLPDGSTGKIAKRNRQYCNEALSLLLQMYPDLYFGKANIDLGDDQIDVFMKSLGRNNPAHTFKNKARFIAKGITVGQKELGWKISIPAIPVVATRERNRFTPNTFEALFHARLLEKQFNETLNDPLQMSETIQLGQILFSAMFYSGLGNKKWHCPFFDIIYNQTFNSVPLWLDFSLNLKDADNTILKRRWFIDPITRTLLFRFLKNQTIQAKKVSPSTAILSFIKYARRNDFHQQMPISYNDIITISQCQLAFKLPSFLTSYASGKIRSVSLPPTALVRLITDKALQKTELIDKHHIKQLKGKFTISRQDEIKISDQTMLFKQLMNCFPRQRPGKQHNYRIKKSLIAFYSNNKNELSPLLVYLIAWGYDLLTNYEHKDLIRGRKKRRLHTNTVHDYLTIIGKKLISVAGELDFEEMEIDELEEVYLASKELCLTSKSQNKFGQCIFQFHQFLVSNYQVLQIDFSDIIEYRTVDEATVSANLISLHEFDKILVNLVPNGYDNASRTNKMQYLMFVLAFRCGLRRTELLKLRIVDTHCLTDPTLLIQANQYAGLKSIKAKRIIPLATLLPPQELKNLLTWRKQRYHEDQKNISNKNLLFCEIGSNDKMLPDNILTSIKEEMWHVTGDHTLKLRHLRHSFATWLTVKLTMDYDDKTKSDYRFLDHPDFDCASCQKIRTSLLGSNNCKRKALYAVANLCGHATPDITTLHYVHVLDWMLGIELSNKRNQPILDAKTIASLTGKTQNQIYYRFKIAQVWQLSNFLPNDIQNEIKLYKIKTKTPERVISKDIITDFYKANIPWKLIETVLKTHYETHRSPTEIAKLFDISENQVVAWINNEKKIKDLAKSFNNSQHLEHRFRKTPDKAPLPQLYKKESEIKLVKKYFKKLSHIDLKARLILQENIQYFLQNYSSGSKGVYFYNEKNINSYLTFLKIVGITNKQIHVNINLPTTADKNTQKQLIEFKLPIKNIESSKSTRKLAIWIQVKTTDTKKTAQRYGSSGFLFCLYITSIALNLVGTDKHFDEEDIDDDVYEYMRLIDDNMKGLYVIHDTLGKQ